MANTYFEFKQFTIHQGDCAMKVTTDACLFGAWVAQHINHENILSRVLDIGSGTGLLSLMAAQNSRALFDAIEIDAAAAAQSAINFAASPWANRLAVHTQAIQTYFPTKLYDTIISNPPFFENDLHANHANRNVAMHSDALKLEELIAEANRLLQPEGDFFVLLPYHRNNYFKQLAANAGWHTQVECVVKQTEKHSFFRSMLWLKKELTIMPLKEEITIKINQQDSDAFIQYLQPFYLNKAFASTPA